MRLYTIVQEVESKKQIRILQSVAVGINAMIFLPPILFELGAEKFARFLYTMLGFLCHQRADRSFYLFGDSLAYPKAEVWEKLPFNEIFTLNFRERFTCGENFGCKFGVCARCTGMYSGLLIGLLVSELLLQWRIPKVIPILLMLPMILDGGVQTIAYIFAPEQGFYESNNVRRLLTGLLFGFGVGYWAVSAIRAPIAKK